MHHVPRIVLIGFASEKLLDPPLPGDHVPQRLGHHPMGLGQPGPEAIVSIRHCTAPLVRSHGFGDASSEVPRDRVGDHHADVGPRALEREVPPESLISPERAPSAGGPHW